jgi:ankyrin repeat protein
MKDKRVDSSADNNFAIRWASRNGHLDVVKELMKDKRVDPSADNNFAIRWASRNGHLDVVKELMKDKRVNSSNINNNYSSQKKILETVQQLLLKDKRVDLDNYTIRWVFISFLLMISILFIIRIYVQS